MKLIEPTRLIDTALLQASRSENKHLSKSRILFIDNQTSFYELLCDFLKREIPNLQILGLCRSSDEVAETIACTRPDLVLMDLCLPNENPREFIRKLKAEHPHVKILITTQWKQLDTTPTLLGIGVNGIVSKQESIKTLSQAIATVLEGKQFLSPFFQQSGAAPPEKSPLSPREALALHLIADGYSTKEMADPLGISIKTAGKYRERIMAKLGINDSIKLTQFAIRNGYYTL